MQYRLMMFVGRGFTPFLSLMINGLHHVGLSVLDLDRAVAFLGAGVGLVVERPRWDVRAGPLAADPGPGAARGVLLRGSRGFVEVNEVPSQAVTDIHPRRVCDPGITHFCVQYRDSAELTSRFEAAGASFHARPVVLGTGYSYSYVRDPEGNVIELEANPRLPVAPEPWLGHVSLSTHDLGGLSEFYAGVLQAAARATGSYGHNPLIDRMTGLEGVEVRMTWFSVSNLSLEIVQYLNPPTVARGTARPVSEPGYSHLCFEVYDLDAAYPRLASAGVRFASEPARVDAYLTAVGCDPDGNVLEFIEFPSGRDEASIAVDSLIDARVVGS